MQSHTDQQQKGYFSTHDEVLREMREVRDQLSREAIADPAKYWRDLAEHHRQYLAANPQVRVWSNS